MFSPRPLPSVFRALSPPDETLHELLRRQVQLCLGDVLHGNHNLFFVFYYIHIDPVPGWAYLTQLPRRLSITRQKRRPSAETRISGWGAVRTTAGWRAAASPHILPGPGSPVLPRSRGPGSPECCQREALDISTRSSVSLQAAGTGGPGPPDTALLGWCVGASEEGPHNSQWRSRGFNVVGHIGDKFGFHALGLQLPPTWPGWLLGPRAFRSWAIWRKGAVEMGGVQLFLELSLGHMPGSLLQLCPGTRGGTQ